MNAITQFLVAHGGPVLFTVVFVEQAGLPLPCAPWLLAAGALCASGGMNAGVAIGMSAAACVIADSLWFYLGRRGANRVVELFCRLPVGPNSTLLRTKKLLDRQGLRGLAIAKFLPGLGTVMPAFAGALGVSTVRFLLFDTLCSFLYGAFYIIAGIVFHNQLQQVLAALEQLWVSVLLVTLVLVAGYISFKYVRRRAVVIGPTPAPSPSSHGLRGATGFHSNRTGAVTQVSYQKLVRCGGWSSSNIPSNPEGVLMRS
jgi:membrane protein DedA with SNARE-associated domain